MIETDYHYFRRRAAEERVAGLAAAHPAAKRSHLELARRYEQFAAASTAEIVELKILRRA